MIVSGHLVRYACVPNKYNIVRNIFGSILTYLEILFGKYIDYILKWGIGDIGQYHLYQYTLLQTHLKIKCTTGSEQLKEKCPKCETCFIIGVSN